MRNQYVGDLHVFGRIAIFENYVKINLETKDMNPYDHKSCGISWPNE